MPQPVDKRFYHGIQHWVWDKHTKVMVGRLVITRKYRFHIIKVVCAKQLLEPMLSFVTYLQGTFGFKKISEITHIYKETLEKADELFQLEYAITVRLYN